MKVLKNYYQLGKSHNQFKYIKKKVFFIKKIVTKIRHVH